MTIDPQEDTPEQELKRSGRRAAAPTGDTFETRKRPSGRRALVVETPVEDAQDASEPIDGEPEIAPTRRSIRRSLDTQRIALVEEQSRLDESASDLPEADLPVDTEVSEHEPEEAEPEIIESERPTPKRNFRAIELAILAFGGAVAVALFVTLSFVPNGDFTPSVGGGIGALLILGVSFAFSKMVAKRANPKPVTESEPEDEAEELQPTEEPAEAGIEQDHTVDEPELERSDK